MNLDIPAELIIALALTIESILILIGISVANRVGRKLKSIAKQGLMLAAGIVGTVSFYGVLLWLDCGVIKGQYILLLVIEIVTFKKVCGIIARNIRERAKKLAREKQVNILTKD